MALKMKFRRYVRGRGRILAFVFIASVIWLLFDIAALRISFSEVNQDQKGKVRNLGRRRDHSEQDVFKHPLQKVNEDKREFVKKASRFDRKIDEVYRQKPEARDVRGKARVAKRLVEQDLATPHKVLSVKSALKQAVPDEKHKAQTVSNTLNVTSRFTGTKAAIVGWTERIVNRTGKPAVQKGKRPPALAGHSVKTVRQTNANLVKLHNDVPVDPGTRGNQTSRVAKPAQTYSPNTNNPKKPNLTPKAVEVKLPEETLRVRRSGGLHKVMALDTTDKPRDPQAVGQYGQAARVPKDKELESQRRWSEGHFNVFLSEQIPVDRAIPDTRPRACSENLVHDELPSTSVIFCFVDEVWSTLLRSVHSVLNRSPPHLLQEIILVDDCSTKDHLKEQLDVYMNQFPKVRIIRLKERQGLIRARMAGAAVATGDVLTFLDSHVECNVGWLEPLLERVYLDRRKVVCPVIEVISDKDMSYMLVDNFQRGVFRWPLVFGWSALSEQDVREKQLKDSDPIRCPVMAGGLFSIDKRYFYELGAYDPGLDVWGGENMEISFKIWMCGGEIEIIPCSRVGHIFRGDNPYKFPRDRVKTVERNLARVAEVWMDQYKELFYGHGYHHLLDRSQTRIGNLTEQIRLRDALHCKSFQWYLENVYPDLDAPLVKAEGLLFSVGARKCLSLEDGVLSFQKCDLSSEHQHFSYTWLRMLRHGTSCLAPDDTRMTLDLKPCDNAEPRLRWIHKSGEVLPEHVMMEGHARPVCVEAGAEGVFLNHCDPNSAAQKWHFTHYYAQ